ncbi:MAG: PadR family transcriptional regulator [Candidatus Rokubacteria bacterium]|nr:PadR family transcriptional regulator [Candidatus Rokubacteria bacterium]
MSLKLAVLGLLVDSPRTGYDLKKLFDGSVGYFWQAKFQQIYGELRQLEGEGLVEKRDVPQVGRPTRKVYSITQTGRAALDAWLDTPSPLSPVRDEFLVKVSSFGRLPPERAVARLREHRHLHEERLATYRTIESRLKEAGWISEAGVAEPLLGGYLTLKRGIAYEEDTIRWCDWAIGLLEPRLPIG